MSDGSTWTRYEFAFQADFTRIPELSPSEWLAWEAKLGVAIPDSIKRRADAATSEVASYLTLRACRKPSSLDIKRKINQIVKQVEDFLSLTSPHEVTPAGTMSPRSEAMFLIRREGEREGEISREHLRAAARRVREDAEAAKAHAVQGRPQDLALRALVAVAEMLVRSAPTGAKPAPVAAVELVVALVDRIAIYAGSANAETNLNAAERALAAEAIAAFAADAPTRITRMIGRDGKSTLRRRKCKNLSIKEDSVAVR